MPSQPTSHKLWPEDPLGPPLTVIELDRIITVPELRVKLGLPALTRKQREDRYRVTFDQQLVTCQRCKKTMPMASTPDHDCYSQDDARRDLESLL